MRWFSVLRLAIVTVAAVMPSLCAAYNITQILAGHPEFSDFNKLLTETRLASDINRRRTITVLAVDNAGMASLESKDYSLPTLRNILSLHVLVDYYGAKKLHQISDGATASSSMFQATGSAPGTTGYVNITNERGGHVAFSAEDATDNSSQATFVKSIKEIPYDIAVLQVSTVLSSPEADAPIPPPAPVNLTDVMSKKYCKAFADLLVANPDVFSTINQTKDSGLTLFCPIDAAVTAFMPKYKNLTAKAQTAILLYHAVPEYYSNQQLKSNSGVLTTLATASVAHHDYSYTVQTSGDVVTVETKVNTASITATVDDSDPLAVYAIDKFLQPKELYKPAAKTLAPAPAPADEPKKKKTKKGAKGVAASPDDGGDDGGADSPDSAPADQAADKAGAVRIASQWATAVTMVSVGIALMV